MNATISLPPTGIREGTLAPWIMWSIWMSRNNKIFSNRFFTARETLDLALLRAREWQEAQEIPRTSGPKKRINRSTIPSSFKRCQTDGAWNEEAKAGGMGWVFLNNKQHQITKNSIAKRNVASPLIAEGLAIRHALIHALDLIPCMWLQTHRCSSRQSIPEAVHRRSMVSFRT
ncbi:unnamed protein product [Microthlaspi erraticum]|uniref:RNase H type-1 domain-containing protein n=1 Tax=Microthlaspi erraticum TaxID=1685480 RepID=A0A6D2I1B8_9BRAS|nr:unnamed protein product [Microthlaspi erraticum]